MNTLSNKAMLVILHISQWAGRKLDKKATATVDNVHGSRKAGNYTKKLLPGAQELKDITTQAGDLRTWFYSQTLPWYTDGTRILSSKNYMDFCSEFRKRKGVFDNTVTAFLNKYTDLKTSARTALGDLFNEADYPTESYIRELFSCDVSFMPMPDVQDFRVSLSEEDVKDFEGRIKKAQDDAMKDVWERLYNVVHNAATKLQTPDAIFRDSLIENINDMCSLLPKLNVTDDPKLEDMRRQVEGIVSQVIPDVCRVNVTERSRAAQALADITDKMTAFMGSN